MQYIFDHDATPRHSKITNRGIAKTETVPGPMQTPIPPRTLRPRLHFPPLRPTPLPPPTYTPADKTVGANGDEDRAGVAGGGVGERAAGSLPWKPTLVAARAHRCGWPYIYAI